MANLEERPERFPDANGCTWTIWRADRDLVTLAAAQGWQRRCSETESALAVAHSRVAELESELSVARTGSDALRRGQERMFADLSAAQAALARCAEVVAKIAEILPQSVGPKGCDPDKPEWFVWGYLADLYPLCRALVKQFSSAPAASGEKQGEAPNMRDGWCNRCGQFTVDPCDCNPAPAEQASQLTPAVTDRYPLEGELRKVVAETIATYGNAPAPPPASAKAARVEVDDDYAMYDLIHEVRAEGPGPSGCQLIVDLMETAEATIELARRQSATEIALNAHADSLDDLARRVASRPTGAGGEEETP